MTTQAAQQYYYGLGRRKCAIAKVRLYPGDGGIQVNGKTSSDYFGRATLDMIVQQPLRVTDSGARFNVVASVYGGGPSGQAGAVRALTVGTAVGHRMPPRAEPHGARPPG